MGGMIPLTDASRRPAHFPIVTTCIIIMNFFVFVLELTGGDAFVLQWSAIPANIMTGHHLITILTAMFMHGSWSHIIGNMVFLWAFGPEIEDAMNPFRYLTFYLLGGVVAMLAQIVATPHSTVPTLGASGAIAAVMGAFLVTYPSDRIRTVLFLLHICDYQIHPSRASHWVLVPYSACERRVGGTSADGWSGIPRSRRWCRLWGCYCPFF